MNFGFLFWLFLIGITVAGLQDLKRREVDDWLNLFLLISGFVFIFYKAIFEKDVAIVFQAGFTLVIMFAIMNIFYYGRVFAGGDAKLLVAMTVFFIGVNFYVTLINIVAFLFLLMLSGSIYGIVFSFVLYYKNREKINKEIKIGFENLWIKYAMLVGVFLLAVSYLSSVFLPVAILTLIFPPLYVFSKALEKISMTKEISGKELREGDWLADDIAVKRKTIKADWDGLSLENIEVLKRERKVKIKEGLPFVPAFFIAFFLYVFLEGWFLSFLSGFI